MGVAFASKVEMEVPLARLDGIIKTLMMQLQGSLDSNVQRLLISNCIWCGAEREKGMELDDAIGEWRCASCGRTSR